MISLAKPQRRPPYRSYVHSVSSSCGDEVVIVVLWSVEPCERDCLWRSWHVVKNWISEAAEQNSGYQIVFAGSPRRCCQYCYCF